VRNRWWEINENNLFCTLFFAGINVRFRYWQILLQKSAMTGRGRLARIS
jgi:hypothetical protein